MTHYRIMVFGENGRLLSAGLDLFDDDTRALKAALAKLDGRPDGCWAEVFDGSRLIWHVGA